MAAIAKAQMTVTKASAMAAPISASTKSRIATPGIKEEVVRPSRERRSWPLTRRASWPPLPNARALALRVCSASSPPRNLIEPIRSCVFSKAKSEAPVLDELEKKETLQDALTEVRAVLVAMGCTEGVLKWFKLRASAPSSPITEDDVLVSTARVRRRGGRVIYPVVPPVVADLSEKKREDDIGNRMTAEDSRRTT